MKKKFITYGSNAFIESSKRIIEEAKSLEIFDEFTRYSEEDLPLPIKSSPLFLSKKGGGYWLWKPFIIHNALQKSNDRDFIIYVDSGCSLKKTPKWEEYFNYLTEYNILFFQYKNDFDYGWNKVNPSFSDCPKIKNWAKKNLINHFSEITDVTSIIEKNKLLAGFIIIKNNETSRELIKSWLDTMLYFPQLVIDPSILEIQDSYFSAHRHDQAIISIISRIYEEKKIVKIIDEDFESESENQAMRTLRKVDPLPPKNIFQKILNQLK